MKVKRHKGCGGEVKDRKCQKCGKTWSRIRYSLTSEIEEKQVRFDEKAYRKRIRDGKDIY